MCANLLISGIILIGRSRGFAFVEFATPEACKLALVQREQQIKNKQCEIKPAKTRENNIAVS